MHFRAYPRLNPALRISATRDLAIHYVSQLARVRDKGTKYQLPLDRSIMPKLVGRMQN